MPRHHRQGNNFLHSIGNTFQHPFQAIGHALGTTIGEIGHGVGSFVGDVAQKGVVPVIQQVGASSTKIISEGLVPLTRTATEGIASDITALASPLQSLSLPLTIGAGILGLVLFRQFFN